MRSAVGAAQRRMIDAASLSAAPRLGSPRPSYRRIVMRGCLIVLLWLVGVAAVDAQQQRPTRFWNLTRHVISELSLAPAGTTDFGPNQCKNDKDGTVDPDERLRITGVPPGTYDVRLKDVSGRQCIVRGVKVEAGEIFSIEEKELTSCEKRGQIPMPTRPAS
jgi:hypothetical protein